MDPLTSPKGVLVGEEMLRFPIFFRRVGESVEVEPEALEEFFTIYMRGKTPKRALAKEAGIPTARLDREFLRIAEEKNRVEDYKKLSGKKPHVDSKDKVKVKVTYGKLPGYYNIQEIAILLNKPLSTVRTWAAKRKLPREDTHVGEKVHYWKIEVVDQWLKERRK